MVGLDKIISQIKEGLREVAEHTRVGARSKVDETLAQIRTDTQRECVDIERHSRQVVINIPEGGRTAVEPEEQGAILTEKQRLIDATTRMAKAEFKELETGTYFDMVLKLAVKFVQPGEGEPLLSRKGLERLPEGFEDRLSVPLKGKGAVPHISGDTRDIDGGFVPTYGGTEENCSIDALFDAVHEALQGKVQEILFS